MSAHLYPRPGASKTRAVPGFLTPRLARMSESRRGFLLGRRGLRAVGAFPLYWPLLEPAGAIEILAHRVLWSVVRWALLVLLSARRPQLVRAVRGRRTLGCCWSPRC